MAIGGGRGVEKTELTGTTVPRKQEHPLNSAVGFSVQWETKVGVEVVAVTVRFTLRLPSSAATVVVVVTVAVLLELTLTRPSKFMQEAV